MALSNQIGSFDSLDFNAPMTHATAERIVIALATSDPVEVVDVGCGWAELLLQLLAANPGARGHGIDHDPVMIERAMRSSDLCRSG